MLIGSLTDNFESMRLIKFSLDILGHLPAKEIDLIFIQNIDRTDPQNAKDIGQLFTGFRPDPFDPDVTRRQGYRNF